MRKIEAFSTMKRNFLSSVLEKKVRESVLVRLTVEYVKLGNDYREWV